VTERGAWGHQDLEYRTHRSARTRALFWSMRTGKSKAVIDKACFQFQKLNIRGGLIFAPNGVHVNWIVNEIPKWTWPEIGPVEAFAWEMPKRGDFAHIDGFERLIQHGGMKWFAVNMESIRFPETVAAVRRYLLSCDYEYLLAISELHHFGHAAAKRTRLAQRLAVRATYLIGETGTPLLSSPLRAYAMFKILMRGRPLAPHLDTYEKFTQHFAIIENIEEAKTKFGRARRKAHKKITGYKNLDELRDLIATHASVVMREDVDDMPELLRIDRPIVMSDLQRRAYLEMVSRHLVEIGDDMVTAKDAGPRMMKLQQIVNGYVIDTATGTTVTIDEEAPIYQALVDEVDGTLPGKTIVWCRYHEDIARCVLALKRAGHKVLEFHGHIPNSKREGIRVAFNTDPKYTVLVGTPGAGGEGRDFSAADCIVFFASTPNAIHVRQGEERGTVKGGKPVTIVRLRTYGTVDDRNWNICDGKVTIADSVSGHGLRDLLRRTNV
jgi:hypothetical protein